MAQVVADALRDACVAVRGVHRVAGCERDEEEGERRDEPHDHHALERAAREQLQHRGYGFLGATVQSLMFVAHASARRPETCTVFAMPATPRGS